MITHRRSSVFQFTLLLIFLNGSLLNGANAAAAKPKWRSIPASAMKIIDNNVSARVTRSRNVWKMAVTATGGETRIDIQPRIAKKLRAVRMKFKLSSGCSVGEFFTGFIVPIGKHGRTHAYLAEVLVNASANTVETHLSSAPIGISGSINPVATADWHSLQLLSNGPEFEIASSYNRQGISTVLKRGRKSAGTVVLQLPRKVPALPTGFVGITSFYGAPPGSFFECVVRIRSIQGFY